MIRQRRGLLCIPIRNSAWTVANGEIVVAYEEVDSTRSIMSTSSLSPLEVRCLAVYLKQISLGLTTCVDGQVSHIFPGHLTRGIY